MAYSVYLETYGCSANKNDAEIIKGLLTSKGFNLVESESIADIIIINTCIVKEPTIKKIEQRIKNLSRTGKKLIISGCMPEVFSKKLSKIAPKASLISTHHLKEIVNVLKKMFKGEKSILLGKPDGKDEIKLCLPKISQNKSIGIIQICQGCINSCSYCLVKKVKGPLFSYPEDKILKEIESNLQSGAKEIWLTSQDNACYGYDGLVSPDFSDKNQPISCSVNLDFEGSSNNFQTITKNQTNTDTTRTNLPRLIKKISSLNHKFFLRIGMMNPSSIQPILNNLIQAYKSDKVFKFLHIPIQSGSDKILKLMNRKYDTKEVLHIIDVFKKEFPEIVIAIDIIVGFPNEDDEDFQKTLDIIENIRPDVLNHSRFWSMKGTEASKMKETVSKSELKKREVELMNLHAKIALENKQKFIGNEYKVLVDDKGFKDTWLARNKNYQLIILRSQENLQGKFLKVKIKEAKAHYLIGEII